MFFKKNSIRKEEKLVNDFIVAMRDGYGIHLKKGADDIFVCQDIAYRENSDFVNYRCRGNELIIDYVFNPIYATKTFSPYYKISNALFENKEYNRIESIYCGVIKDLNIASSEYGKFFIEGTKEETEIYGYHRYRTFNLFESKGTNGFGGANGMGLSKIFYPSISFKNGKLLKKIVLTFCAEDSLIASIYGSFKNTIIDIVEYNGHYEIEVYCETYSIKVSKTIISYKTENINDTIKKICRYIKGTTLNPATLETLNIKHFEDFKEEHENCLKLLKY